jgi:ABC-type branched-subunit amino acid transport system ATPase component
VGLIGPNGRGKSLFSLDYGASYSGWISFDNKYYRQTTSGSSIGNRQDFQLNLLFADFTVLQNVTFLSSYILIQLIPGLF